MLLAVFLLPNPPLLLEDPHPPHQSSEDQLMEDSPPLLLLVDLLHLVLNPLLLLAVHLLDLVELHLPFTQLLLPILVPLADKVAFL